MQIFKDLQENQRREAKRRLAVKMVLEQEAMSVVCKKTARDTV